jgi:hypothetical protein
MDTKQMRYAVQMRLNPYTIKATEEEPYRCKFIDLPEDLKTRINEILKASGEVINPQLIPETEELSFSQIESFAIKSHRVKIVSQKFILRFYDIAELRWVLTCREVQRVNPEYDKLKCCLYQIIGANSMVKALEYIHPDNTITTYTVDKNTPHR